MTAKRSHKIYPSIATWSAIEFDFLKPKPEMVSVKDVAHHLSLINRYVGATHEAYSVAQHSVWVSHGVEESLAGWGLIHDAPEYVLGDVSSPLKVLLPDYREVYDRVAREAVFPAFGLDYYKQPAQVKEWDWNALLREKLDLMNQPAWWVIDTSPVHGLPHLKPWTAARAEREFLHRFYELMDKGLLKKPPGDKK